MEKYNFSAQEAGAPPFQVEIRNPKKRLSVQLRRDSQKAGSVSKKKR